MYFVLKANTKYLYLGSLLFLGAITIPVPTLHLPLRSTVKRVRWWPLQVLKGRFSTTGEEPPRLLIWAFVEDLLYSCPPLLLREGEKTQLPDVKSYGV